MSLLLLTPSMLSKASCHVERRSRVNIEHFYNLIYTVEIWVYWISTCINFIEFTVIVDFPFFLLHKILVLLSVLAMFFVVNLFLSGTKSILSFLGHQVE